MSGFTYVARLAQDAAAPYGRRYIALRQAVGSYAYLRGASFQAVYAELGAQFGFDDRVRRPSPEQITVALEKLIGERNAFLSRLGAFAAERRAEKACGQRTLRKGQLNKLFPPRPHQERPSEVSGERQS